MKTLAYALSVLAAAGIAAAQAPAWGQCGGIGWSGPTTCISGWTCTYLNDYHSQCLQITTTATTIPPTGTTSVSSSTPTPSICGGYPRTKFKYFGVNQSGAEFGQTKIPGVLGKDYTWPSKSSVDFFLGKGMNTFRIAFLMERLSPPAKGLIGPFDSIYLASLKDIVSYVTSKGGYAVIDPHNFMIYNGTKIASTSNFATWWKNLASQFKSNKNVIFDIMNEPHDIPASTAFALNQAAVNAIRASGATSQLILVEGTSWTGAWTWEPSGNGDAFKAIKDPNNNIAIEMHQYLDSDGSGTSPICDYPTVAADRLTIATNWLLVNGYRGFLGEFGGGSNDDCIAAIKGGLCMMQESGVWIGALWWAAGPWWGDYFQSIEPPSGAAISRILPEALLPFL